MRCDPSLTDLIIHAIATGYLEFMPSRTLMHYQLETEDCTIRGWTGMRPDWTDNEGRPGALVVIETVEALGEEEQDFEKLNLDEEKIYDLLRQRMSAKNILYWYQGQWHWSTINDRPLGGLYHDEL